MINELVKVGCPDEKIMHYGELMIANMKETFEKSDSRKLE